MISRRLLILGAASTLGACQYCYEEEELLGVYRARGTRIGQTLTLRSGGVYLHSWQAQQVRIETTGAWGAHCTIELDNFALPAAAERISTAYFHGGPPAFWSRRPIIFSAEPDISFVPTNGE